MTIDLSMESVTNSLTWFLVAYLLLAFEARFVGVLDNLRRARAAAVEFEQRHREQAATHARLLQETAQLQQQEINLLERLSHASGDHGASQPIRRSLPREIVEEEATAAEIYQTH